MVRSATQRLCRADHVMFVNDAPCICWGHQYQVDILQGLITLRSGCLRSDGRAVQETLYKDP